jgi:hypothetical protein
MIIRITLKDPDGVYESIKDACNFSSTASEKAIDKKLNQVYSSLKTWIWLEEYITIEFDTDKGTATVLKVEELDKEK